MTAASASCRSAASPAGTLAGACTLVPRPVLSNRARVNCAASGISLSDGERPRAPSFARCVVAVVMGGLLKGLTVQAGTVCPLREAEHGLTMARSTLSMRVSASRCRGEPLCLSGPSFGMWISIFFLKTHLDRRRAAAGARAKPAKPGRRVLRRGGPLRRPSLRRQHAHQFRLRAH